MKLSSPLDVRTNINAQKKIDIDQSIKLSNELAGIKKKLYSEKREYELFRTNTIKVIQKQIDNKIIEKEDLIKSIQTIDKKQEKKVKKIADDLLRIKKENTDLIELSNENCKMGNYLIKESKNIKLSKSRIEKETKQVDEARQQLSYDVNNSLNTIEQAKKITTAINKKVEDVDKYYKQKINEIKSKEAVLTSSIEYIEIEKKKISNEYKNIAEEKIRAKDMRETLQRSINRLKAKKQ